MSKTIMLLIVLCLSLLTSPVYASNSSVSIGIYMPGIAIQFGTPGPPPSEAYYDGPYIMVGIGIPLYYYGGSFFYKEGGAYHYYGRCSQKDYPYYNNHWQQHYNQHQAYPHQYGPPENPTHPRAEWHPDQEHYQKYPYGRQIQGRAPYQGSMRQGWNPQPQQGQGPPRPPQGYQGQGHGNEQGQKYRYPQGQGEPQGKGEHWGGTRQQ